DRSFPQHHLKYALNTKSSFAAALPSISSSLPDVQPDQVPIPVHPATGALVYELLPGQYLNAASFLLKTSRSFYSSHPANLQIPASFCIHFLMNAFQDRLSWPPSPYIQVQSTRNSTGDIAVKSRL